MRIGHEMKEREKVAAGERRYCKDCVSVSKKWRKRR
jgi:hypothetical protein